MGTTVASGLSGVTLNVGDHICAFYRGTAERDQILLPYLRAGVRAGDKCLAVLDSTDPGEVEPVLAHQTAADSDQVTLYCSEDSYLLGGEFSPEDMLAFWEGGASAAVVDEGYPFLRAVGEMTWALRDLPGVELLVAYEAELNRFLPKYPQTILCLYDLERFTDGELLIEILRTHPKVLMSGTAIDNPWYIDPDELLVGGM